MSRFRHYIYFAILVGITIPCLFYVADSSFRFFQLFVSCVYVFTVCTVIHAAIWSVFGTGSYFYRFSVSLMFALPVMVGGGLGVAYLVRAQSRSEAVSMVCAIPLICFSMLMAAQIPLWILRMGFGWQLVRDGEQRESLALKQLFAVTFVCALALSIPRPVLTNLVMSSNEPAVGTTQYFPESDADGNWEMNEVLVTEENLSVVRVRAIRQAQEQADSMLFNCSAYVAACCVLTLPLIWFSFRFRRIRAIGWSAGYCLGLLVLVVAAWGAIIGFDYVFRDIAPEVLSFFALYTAMICVPLSISRSKGFRLVTGRRTTEENQNSDVPLNEPSGS